MENGRDILFTRSKIKKGEYSYLTPGGLVQNVIPQMKNCQVSILASPRIGAEFVQYLIRASKGGGTNQAFGRQEMIELFLYVLEGEGELLCGGRSFAAKAGSYLYVPPGAGVEFVGGTGTEMKLFLHKQRYIPAEGVEMPELVFGSIQEKEKKYPPGDKTQYCQELLPSDLRYDLAMNLLTFYPGAGHGFVETHVQEHGIYFLEGKSCYLVDDQWIMMQKGDYLWLGPYVPQAGYGVGDTPYSYLLSKDSNRDAEL